MAWFHSANNDDLNQSLELATEAAADAQQAGDQKRARGFQRDIAGMSTERDRRDRDKGGKRKRK